MNEEGLPLEASYTLLSLAVLSLLVALTFSMLFPSWTRSLFSRRFSSSLFSPSPLSSPYVYDWTYTRSSERTDEPCSTQGGFSLPELISSSTHSSWVGGRVTQLLRRTMETDTFRSLRSIPLESVPEHRRRILASSQSFLRRLENTDHLCLGCWARREFCYCDRLPQSVLPLPSWLHIHLFMHPREVLRSSNSGRLLLETFPYNTSLHVMGIEPDEPLFFDFIRQYNDRVFVLFPSTESRPIRKVVDEKSDEIQSYVRRQRSSTGSVEEEWSIEDAAFHIVLLDGTWSQGKSMWKLMRETCPKVQCVRIEPECSPRYRLRRAYVEGRLSTCEAAIAALSELGLDEQADSLTESFDAMIPAALRAMGKQHSSKAEGLLFDD